MAINVIPVLIEPREAGTNDSHTEQLMTIKATEVIRNDPFNKGKVNTMIINLDQLALGLYEMGAGPLLQNAFPYLTAGEREFIKTGITPDSWDKMFGGSEE